MAHQEIKKVEMNESRSVPEFNYSVDPIAFAHYNEAEALCSPELTEEAEKLLKALPKVPKEDRAGALQRITRFFKKNEENAVQKNKQNQQAMVVTPSEPKAVAPEEKEFLEVTSVQTLPGATRFPAFLMIYSSLNVVAAMEVGAVEVFAENKSPRPFFQVSKQEVSREMDLREPMFRETLFGSAPEASLIGASILFGCVEPMQDSILLREEETGESIWLPDRSDILSAFWTGLLLNQKPSTSLEAVSTSAESREVVSFTDPVFLTQAFLEQGVEIYRELLEEHGKNKNSLGRQSVFERTGFGVAGSNHPQIAMNDLSLLEEVPYQFVGFPFIPKGALVFSVGTTFSPSHDLKSYHRIESRDPSQGSGDSQSGSNSNREPKQDQEPFFEELATSFSAINK